MILRPALTQSSAAKIGLFGPPSSGKSLTSLLIAIGISKELYGGAGIAFVDSEDIEQFIKPICDIEGVPLVIAKSRSFVDMREAFQEAEQAQLCAFVVDHYDGIFRELTEAQKTRLNLHGRKLPYQHREELVKMWDAWVRQFRASALHCVFNGRLAWEWGDDEDESGEAVKVKLGAKMRGESDAGYEPDLLIELEAIQDQTKRHKKTRSRSGTITHWLHVLKDRRLILNGLSFSWKDLNGYHAGDYQGVWRAVEPHFRGRTTSDLSPRGESVQRSSAMLFQPVTGESAFSERQRRVTIAIEEIQGALNTLWPGQTADDKRLRYTVMETLFRTRSWTAINAFSAEVVEHGWKILQHFEADAASINVHDEAAVIALIVSCKELEAERTESMVL
jgi:hypothetical protein